MTTTYVGFYRPASTEALAESQRSTGTTPAPFREKINAFPSSLPSTCTLVGSWGVSGNEAPGVMIVEAESFADLQHINQYYAGWLVLDWHPTVSVPRNL